MKNPAALACSFLAKRITVARSTILMVIAMVGSEGWARRVSRAARPAPWSRETHETAAQRNSSVEWLRIRGAYQTATTIEGENSNE